MSFGRRTRRIGLGVALIASVAACGGGGGGTSSASSSGGGQNIGGSLTVWAKWASTEQADFQKVLDGFSSKTGISAQYQSKGDNLPTVLSTAVAGGAPPDVAILPQPGLLHDLVAKGALKPIDSVVGDVISSDFNSVWKDLGSDGGKLYGVYFKGANKSTVWYNVKTYTSAGITSSPTTMATWLRDLSTLKQFGTVPFAMCGGSGWTLTDWFENVYLRTAGVDNYNKLAKHTIPWTDSTVTTALQQMQKIFTPDNMVGGVQGAVSTPFPDCVGQVFGPTPKAATLYEADFVGSVIPTVNSSLQPTTGFDFYPFPSINGSPPSVSAGGDVAVMLKDTPQSEALMKYLASPDAGAIWAHLGGFTAPNKKVALAVYPDAIARKAAKALIDAGNNVAFDMSDQAPAAFGGTAGSGEWGDLQTWLRNTSDISGIEAKLEADAKAAYGH